MKQKRDVFFGVNFCLFTFSTEFLKLKSRNPYVYNLAFVGTYLPIFMAMNVHFLYTKIRKLYWVHTYIGLLMFFFICKNTFLLRLFHVSLAT